MAKEKNPESYRDRPLILDEGGSRKWIFARQPQGVWYTRRSLVGYLLLVFLIIAPLLSVDNHPFMRIDIIAKKFYLFGAVIGTHDTYLLALIMAIAVVSVILFTVVFGRIFCGWLCPHTIFLEMVYRSVEYLFDGNYRKNKTPLSYRKPIRKVLKHTAFILISIFFTHVFLAWFIGYDEVFSIIQDPISMHYMGLFFMILISGFYYFVYAYLREQICTLFCPYGRLQGVLLDSKSIQVIYDYKRGEPRGAKTKGDCIDCGACIAVCPTGIDIKNGSQLECVNCTACIDECNLVMRKVHKPTNLIRYDSVHGIETGKNNLLNARTIGYSIVLAILFTVLVFSLYLRNETETYITRMPGTLYQEISTTEVSNLYKFKISNKTNRKKIIVLDVVKPALAEIKLVDTMELKDNYEGIMQIVMPTYQISSENTPIILQIKENGVVLEEKQFNFIGPKR